MRSYRSDHRNPRRLRYGWRLTAAGHIVVDDVQRQCIFLILALRGQAHTLQSICDALAAGEWPPPRQGAWYCATVRKIIEQNAPLACLLPHLAARGLPRRRCPRARDERRLVQVATTARAAGPRRMHQALEAVHGV